MSAFIFRSRHLRTFYNAVQFTDAQFPPHPLINRLTEKQQRAFIVAYTLGYYDVPKKIGIVQLAESSPRAQGYS